ncbi:MAG: molybdopterin-dependent oxidoreductase, partial [Burkholderiaceae bacterium]
MPDFAHTDCVLLWGTNPADTWLARVGEVRKAMRRGARIIVVDPRRTPLARGNSCWLPVRPGTDRILALGLANLLIEGGGFDAGFVRRWTNGPMLVRLDTGRLLRHGDLAEPVAAAADACLLAEDAEGRLHAYDPAPGSWIGQMPSLVLDSDRTVTTRDGPVRCRSGFALFAEQARACPPERVEAITGVPRERLREAAQILAQASSVAYFTWNGTGQSADATQTDRALSILIGLTGAYGGRGGNVPGSAAEFADLSGAAWLGQPWAQQALGRDRLPLGPPTQGWVSARDVYTAILESRPYPVRMLFSFGGNLLASQPEPERARQALGRLEFHVHADFFLNASAAYADIVLPVATAWER